MMRRFIGLAVMLLVLFYAVSHPAQAASVVRSLISAAFTFVSVLIGGQA